MFYRKDAVSMAVASLLACTGYAMADTTELKTPTLSLQPQVVTADDAGAPSGLLMQGLDKVGAAKYLNDYKLNIYGWVEGGYTFLHRRVGGEGPLTGHPFDHEFGNHFMLNQLVIRIEKLVDPTKFDVGGAVDFMYGSDAARIHSTGLGYNGTDATDDGAPADAAVTFANYHPIWQFDIPQAYVDVNVPVGNGLKVRAGKFYTLVGYETVDPRGNAFYSKSYLFNAEPLTHTGVLAFYSINDQWSIAGGITRGWDVATEDTNGCSIDTIGQLTYVPIKDVLTVYLNWTVGPEDFGDSSHYRALINPIVVWQVNDKLKLAAEGLYVYDGGRNAFAPSGLSHGYGDVWGLAIYGSYVINEYLTFNARVEKYHDYADSFSVAGSVTPGVPTVNVYEATIGLSIKPMPKDPIGQNLTVRPEIRYDYSEDHVFFVGRGVDAFRDQLTFGADFIFTF